MSISNEEGKISEVGSHSETIDMYRDFMKAVSSHMNNIEDIALEVDEFNTLYLALSDAKNNILRVIRAQHEVEKNYPESSDPVEDKY